MAVYELKIMAKEISHRCRVRGVKYTFIRRKMKILTNESLQEFEIQQLLVEFVNRYLLNTHEGSEMNETGKINEFDEV